MWSYCRYTQRLLAIAGDSSRRAKRFAVRKGGPLGQRPASARRRDNAGRLHRSVVDRSVIGERAGGNLGDDRAALANAHQAVIRDVADVRGMKIPLVENLLDLALTAALDDQQHPLLRFGEHDFVRRHAGLALRNVGHVDVDARSAARSHFARGAGEARGAHVLDADRARRSSSLRGTPREEASP